MLILLPPSEGKVLDGGESSLRERHPELTPDIEAILKHTDSLGVEQRRKFYGAKDKEKSGIFQALNQEVLGAPCLCALERYSGVVYQHLDFPNLKKKRKAKSRILIVSGLLGAISGGTYIPAYRMPINSWLANYWRERNAGRLANSAHRKRVLSLLPQAYAKAVGVEQADTVDFRVQGGRKQPDISGKP